MITLEKRDAAVAEAVLNGLTKSPKQLPSWLFYDERGDQIFQAIMRMPEYYPTRCEYEILQSYKTILWNYFNHDDSPFQLIEFGAGDGLKTEILLQHFASVQTSFSYLPVDVSKHVVAGLKERLKKSLPDLPVIPIHSRNEEALRQLPEDGQHRKVFLYLGANIGNYDFTEAQTFISKIAAAMNSRDQFLIGFDLKKDPRIIQAAYDDAQGITRDFNLNLLLRLNRELGAHFNPAQFTHYPYYDPESGMARSYLISLQTQDVYFEYFDRTFHFDSWETIHTEVSLKYDMPMIQELARKAGLEIVRHFFDRNHYFCDVLFKKIRG